MTNIVDSGTFSDLQFSRFAQIAERAGLAIMGAMGGFFVAALVSHADIGEINYPFVFAEVDRLGFTGWIGCEYRPRAKTEAGLGWGRQYGLISTP